MPFGDASLGVVMKELIEFSKEFGFLHEGGEKLIKAN